MIGKANRDCIIILRSWLCCWTSHRWSMRCFIVLTLIGEVGQPGSPYMARHHAEVRSSAVPFAAMWTCLGMLAALHGQGLGPERGMNDEKKEELWEGMVMEEGECRCRSQEEVNTTGHCGRVDRKLKLSHGEMWGWVYFRTWSAGLCCHRHGFDGLTGKLNCHDHNETMVWKKSQSSS